MKSKDPRGCATAEWLDQYAREKEKAEKQLVKKQLTHPVIMTYVKWIHSKCKSDIKHIEEQIIKDDKESNVFYWYYQSEKTREYPQKQIFVSVKNENYRPNLLFNKQGYRGYDYVDKLDIRLQQRGWEWVEENNGRTEQHESYPYEYSYYSYDAHPEYRLVNMTNRGDFALFDKDGNFVRFPYLSHENIIRWHNPNLIETLLMLEYRKDYVNNKYNIKKEDQDVQYAIVNKLGFSKESDARMAKAISKGMEGSLLFKYSNDW